MLWQLILIVSGLITCFGGDVIAAESRPIAEARVEDLAGHAERLQFGSQVKAVVFLFVCVECPISNSYAPEFKRLGAEFGSRNVLFKLVYPNVDESADTIRKHLKEFGLSMPALRDPWHDLVKAADVNTTPEAAVFVPQSGFVYHGRIDNRYADLGVARPEATQHDLKEALTAILEGKSVARKSARAIGCSIPPLPR